MTLSKEEIREIRNKTGLTQEEFAKTYKIPATTLAFWEQGRRGARLAGASIVYLKLIQSDPEAVARMVRRLSRQRRRFVERAA